MIITRPVQCFVCEDDKEKKKEYMNTLFKWRNAVRRAANLIASHKFVQHEVRDFIYLKDDVKEKFYIKDIIKDQPGMSEQNVTYRLIAEYLKPEGVPSAIISALNQNVVKSINENYKDVWKGESSLRTYRNNIPIPFGKRDVRNLAETEGGHFGFSLFGIPIRLILGRDRSNNRGLLRKIINGEAELCSCSIKMIQSNAWDEQNNKERKNIKMMLYMCVDVPEEEKELDEKKVLTAFLGVENPILCHYKSDIVEKYRETRKDSGNMYLIGSREEYLYRRTQIQDALQRCQTALRYSKGGHGRKRKLQALDRWHEVEKDYINTRVHTYSKKLVDIALKNQCKYIVLAEQAKMEFEAKKENIKGNPFILRNWSYFKLKEYILYKAKKYGIMVVVEGEKKTKKRKNEEQK